MVPRLSMCSFLVHETWTGAVAVLILFVSDNLTQQRGGAGMVEEVEEDNLFLFSSSQGIMVEKTICMAAMKPRQLPTEAMFARSLLTPYYLPVWRTPRPK